MISGLFQSQDCCGLRIVKVSGLLWAQDMWSLDCSVLKLVMVSSSLLSYDFYGIRIVMVSGFFFTYSQPGPIFIFLFVKYAHPRPRFEPGTGGSSGRDTNH